MRDIARLVFGGEPDDPDLRDADGQCCPGGQESPFTRGMPRPHAAGEWCQAPPGDAALSWLAASVLGREPKPRRNRRGR